MTHHGKAVSFSTPIEGSSSKTPIEGPSERVSDSSTGSTQQSGEDQINDSEITFATETVHEIETVVESFWTGKMKKSQAIFKIGQLLAAEPDGNEQLKTDSLERYSFTLDGIEALSAKLDKHGTQFTNPVLGKRIHEPSEGNR